MKICVLQPDYSTSIVDYRHYDPTRDLARLAPQHQVDHVKLHKLTVYKQLRALAREGYDIFVNLTDGYLEWDIPSIDVIHSLDALGLPYTGPSAALYHPAKELMKYVAQSTGVRIPAYDVVESVDELARVARRLFFPLFVKPSWAGDSLGIDEHSLARDAEALRAKVVATLPDYPQLLVEEYIEGREFTVLVMATPDGPRHCTSFLPIEFIFDHGAKFKTYAMKTSELHPDANVPVRDAALAARLRSAAEKVFTGFNGVGYARMDFRMDPQGDLYFLEVNFSCSLFYSDGLEGSTDYILKHDGIGQAGFLEMIIVEGRTRYERKQKLYVVRGSSIAGFGIYARRDIAPGEVVFKGEERSQRIVTREYVRQHWSADEQEVFRHYAYPLSDEVFVLWADDPADWAPQNHSCEPNTVLRGLDLVAQHAVPKGAELTLDFATLQNPESEPFTCNCGTASCRGQISGTPGNSVTVREKARRIGRA